jgi:hypothetical protein
MLRVAWTDGGVTAKASGRSRLNKTNLVSFNLMIVASV